jgi:hypothetical protein
MLGRASARHVTRETGKTMIAKRVIKRDAPGRVNLSRRHPPLATPTPLADLAMPPTARPE